MPPSEVSSETLERERSAMNKHTPVTFVSLTRGRAGPYGTARREGNHEEAGTSPSPSSTDARRRAEDCPLPMALSS